MKRDSEVMGDRILRPRIPVGASPVKWAQRLVDAVVSMGRRNTFLKFTRRSLKT